MKLRHLSILLAAAAIWASSISGQSTPRLNAASNPQGHATNLAQGVVVEEIKKGSAADKAGIQAGDVVSGWSQGDSKGKIESPFDLELLEVEQGPRGKLTLEGSRETESRSWILEADAWGLTTRPNFTAALLSSYQSSQDLIKAGKAVEAAQSWSKGANRAEIAEVPWLRAWMLERAALLLENAQLSKEADSGQEEAVQSAPDSSIREQLLREWADRCQQRREWDKAETHYRAALAESKKIADETPAGTLDLYGIARVSFDRDGPASAEPLYRQFLAGREKVFPDTLNLSDSLCKVAEAILEFDPSQSEEYAGRCLAIAEKWSDSQRMSHALDDLGIIEGQREDLVKAEQYLRRAEEVQAKFQPEDLLLATILTDLASVIFERGDLDQAEKYYLQALDLANRLSPGSTPVASALNNLGNVALGRGDLVKAENYFTQAFLIFDKVKPGSLKVAAVFTNLGDVALKRGKLDDAEKHYQDGLKIREQRAPGSLYMAESLGSLAEVARRLGNLDKAGEYYHKALAIQEKLSPGSVLQAQTLAALAGIARQKLQPAAAAQLLAQAIEALENQTTRLGGSEEARSGFRADYLAYYNDYIDLLISQKQTELAFEMLEHSRARSLLETLAAGKVDVRRGVNPDLLKEERRLKESLSADANRRVRLMGAKHTDSEVSELDSEIKGLVGQYQDVEAQIRTSSPGYAALTQPHPISAREVQQQLLDPDTLLLEYTLGAEHSYVFAVTHSSMNAYRLPARAEIEDKAKQVYELLTARNHSVKGDSAQARQSRVAKADAAYPSEAMALSRTLLGPVAKELSYKRLLIVSDGALQYIPFAALPSPTASQEASPLAVSHEVVNLPSASALAVLRNEHTVRRPAEKEVAVFADPVFTPGDPRVNKTHDAGRSTASGANNDAAQPADSTSSERLTRSAADLELAERGQLSLPRLLFTRDEAEAIVGFARRGATMKKLDFEASRSAALNADLGKYRIVHFATHALVDNVHPELSGLVLSLVDRNGLPQDGFLELEDVYNLDLSADLVVLSACQTALGKEISGEGQIGLTRGFMYAGAASVISTLWKVDDFATAKLMGHFYKAMERDGMKPAQALRQAQIELWKERRWSAPYYWAGFTLQGEWK